MANQGERPRKRVLRLLGKRPKVKQQTPVRATVDGRAALPRLAKRIRAVISGRGTLIAKARAIISGAAWFPRADTWIKLNG